MVEKSKLYYIPFRFKFSLLNIEPGTILTFAKDSEIKCKVIDDKFVESNETIEIELQPIANIETGKKQNDLSVERTT